MIKYCVTYGVRFITEVEVTEGEVIEDVISDIKIPEDEKSTYCANSFEIAELKQIN